MDNELLYAKIEALNGKALCNVTIDARSGAFASFGGKRSGAPSALRPSTFVMSDTPVEVQFTSAGCLNYPCRTPIALTIETPDSSASAEIASLSF
jgi:hypothetical protein